MDGVVTRLVASNVDIMDHEITLIFPMSCRFVVM